VESWESLPVPGHLLEIHKANASGALLPPLSLHCLLWRAPRCAAAAAWGRGDAVRGMPRWQDAREPFCCFWQWNPFRCLPCLPCPSLSLPPHQDLQIEISSLVRRRVALYAAAGIPKAAVLIAKYTQGGWDNGGAFVLGATSSSFAGAGRPALLCSSHCQHAVAAWLCRAAPSGLLLPLPPFCFPVVDRKLVKQTVMRSVYGFTLSGRSCAGESTAQQT
jgi:hypothetical protein